MQKLVTIVTSVQNNIMCIHQEFEWQFDSSEEIRAVFHVMKHRFIFFNVVLLFICLQLGHNVLLSAARLGCESRSGIRHPSVSGSQKCLTTVQVDAALPAEGQKFHPL